MNHRMPPALMLAVLAGLLSACAGDGLTESVRAAQGRAPDPATQDFVVQSRAAAPTGYIPVGVTPPSRATPVRNPNDVTRLEKELDGQRNAARSFARRPAPKSPYSGLPAR